MSKRNHFQIIGNIGRDAELKYLSSGKPVCNFSVAVTETYKKDGEKMQDTMWVKVALWGDYAETMHQYLTKGKLVMVTGKAKPSAYINDAGEAVPVQEIAFAEIELLGGGKSDYASEEGELEQKPQPVPTPKAQTPAPKQNKPAAAQKKEEAPWDMPPGAGELTF